MTRVGLDRGFDGGAAAWAIDLQGCVATAPSDARALELVPDRVAAFVAWLRTGGESPSAPLEGDVEVVERVDSYRVDDGYEVNATFEADRRPVTRDEADVALRWLGLAHERLGAAISAAGDRRLSGEGRTTEEVLRHVARAERWLATRVEPDQSRIVFPADDVPVEMQLQTNRPFVREHVLAAAGGDGVHERVDSKGESWTTRKILRRLVYHVLDHAEEIERRAASSSLPAEEVR